jgi:hypothetical protein
MSTTTSSAAAAPATSLRRLLEERASAADITRFLDGLAPADRVEEVLAVTGKWVGRLYKAMAGSPLTSVDELVPADERGTIIYEGRNSLPMFSRFQKRFTRLDGVAVGYNHQSMSFFTGPGYFVVKPPSGQGELGDEVYFDYTEAPPGEPPGWPAYKPNTAGLSRAVYANMKDYMRRVARGVVVGKAYKLGVDQGAYFSLSRAM